ncbi:hypothetical protein SLEP1_g53883 [Rubroshorea leprosula]|uniref:Pvs-trna-like protein n=1 Tax=Rubroshorea leprosula TaxID=152421 RepID=A0AAV5MAW6_9ROSI|nr:hypothetical protein SLEP1_g53883 [Rubroshorea leprosula]
MPLTRAPLISYHLTQVEPPAQHQLVPSYVLLSRLDGYP